ncbi:hypothetical protein ACNS7O_13085 [Haloferacaceae archaeon DSL9]
MRFPRARAVAELPTLVWRWWREIAGEAPLAEKLAVFVLVPLALTGIWLSPASDGWQLSLANESLWTNEWTLWTAFASNYTHLDGGHLFDNVLNYLVTAFAVYPLAILGGWRRGFRRAFLVSLVVAPFFISWVTIVTLGDLTDQSSLGFSGINTALLGVLLAVLFHAASVQTDGGISRGWAPVVFCLALAVAFATPNVSYFPIRPSIAGGLALVAALTTVGVLTRGRPRVPNVGESTELALLIGATVFVTGVLGSMVLVRPGINVWGHLAGFVFGFGYAFAALAYASVRPSR